MDEALPEASAEFGTVPNLWAQEGLARIHRDSSSACKRLNGPKFGALPVRRDWHVRCLSLSACVLARFCKES